MINIPDEDDDEHLSAHRAGMQRHARRKQDFEVECATIRTLLSAVRDFAGIGDHRVAHGRADRVWETALEVRKISFER